MRRGATLSVVIGLTLAGIWAFPVARARAQARQQPARRLAALVTAVSAAQMAGTARAARTGGTARTARTKAVSFDGYTVDVPASWPVYRLAGDPARCVRYDRHAVYLGSPGPNQQCPAHLVGRVTTVTLQASAPSGLSAAPAVWHRAPARMGLAKGLAGIAGMAMQDAPDRELRAVISHPGLTVTATYGGNAALAARIIRSVRRTPGAGWAAAAQASRPVPARKTAGVPPAQSAFHRVIRHRHRRHRRHRRQRRLPTSPAAMAGFDTCTAPSLSVMQKWRAEYSAAAIYIGGPAAACGYGNLSAAWVQSATQMGWSLIPTYVGPQAPCSKFHSRIKIGRARAEGRAAADDAVRLAQALGLPGATPIYDDMEWFNPHKGMCRRQVLSFLNEWTRELHHRGYVSGVYSSASSAVRDLSQASNIYGQRLARPNAIWFALWDGKANLQGMPYVPANRWAGNRRIKQYQGSHRQRIDGATLHIDSDLVAGPVYR